MILKPFEPYDTTLGLAALKKRLPKDHERYNHIADDLSKQEAGDKGEKVVMENLSTAELPKDTYVLHNVSFISKVEMQIDILVISPSWCLIMEVKNWSGILHFNDNPPQVVCEKEGQLKYYSNPESQLEQYCFGLESFLKSHHIRMPIYGVIVFPFSNVYIKKPATNFQIKLGKDYIRYIWSLQTDKTYVDPKEVGELLLKQQAEWRKFPLCQYYGINKEEVLKGVECPNCGTFPIKRTLRTWYCENCNKFFKDAHRKALNDYKLLISDTITSSEALTF